MSNLKILSNSTEPFSGRIEAGRLLARELDEYRGREAIVLGIPRGGLVVAKEMAERLDAAMDVVLTHKLGAPVNAELAIGAICEDGTVFIDKRIASYTGADEGYIKSEKQHQLAEITRKVEMYRDVIQRLEVQGRVVIVTDDGVATGATMQAALWVLRRQKPLKLILALPVGPEDSVMNLAKTPDETICLRCPPYFDALGRFFLDFGQVEDASVLDILEWERARRGE